MGSVFSSVWADVSRGRGWNASGDGIEYPKKWRKYPNFVGGILVTGFLRFVKNFEIKKIISNFA